MIAMHLQLQIVCTLIILNSSNIILVLGFQFSYQPGRPALNFDLQSNSDEISPSWSNDRLWLTPELDTIQPNLLNGIAGRVIYTLALPLFDHATNKVLSFNTFLNFSIITTNIYGDSANYGLAFSISPVLNMTNYSAGGTLGIAGQNASDSTSYPDHHLFAVEFDTYQNPLFSDPSASHVGIDFNGLTSNATFDSNDPQSDLYLYNNYTYFVWVEYDASVHLTQVFAANSSERPAFSCVNATYDLSNLFDPNQAMYAAISAATGSAVQGTSLFSWSFAVISDAEVSSPALSPENGFSPLISPETGLSLLISPEIGLSSDLTIRDTSVPTSILPPENGVPTMTFSPGATTVIFPDTSPPPPISPVTSPPPPISPVSPISPETGLSPLIIPESGLPFSSWPPPPTSRLKYVLPLTLSLLGVLLLLAVCVLRAFCRKRKEQSSSMIQLIHNSTGSVPRLSYWDLKKATHGFHDARKVGEGGFSSVYKGILSTGDVVAVKRLKEGLRMEEEFASEIKIISKIRHRNLLQLRGWGYEAGEALLVYQYMRNGSLDSYLFGKERGEKGLLDGRKRYSILVGVAAGLEYLHEGLGECVLHRDVKAANVMLAESFEAMLGDFGLARLITHNQVVTMTAAGTPGYVAPEVVYTGRATDRADVYSFGILALEVASGRRALDGTRPPEELYLLDWAWQLQQSGNLMDALDPVCCPSVPVNQLEQELTRYEAGTIASYTEANIAGIMVAEAPLVVQALASGDQEHMASDGYSSQEDRWQCVLHLALLCCNPFPEDRPTMRHVHQALREGLIFPLPSIRPTYSRPGAAFSPSFDFSISSSAPSSALDTSSSLYTAPSSLFAQ